MTCLEKSACWTCWQDSLTEVHKLCSPFLSALCSESLFYSPFYCLLFPNSYMSAVPVISLSLLCYSLQSILHLAPKNVVLIRSFAEPNFLGKTPFKGPHIYSGLPIPGISALTHQRLALILHSSCKILSSFAMTAAISLEGAFVLPVPHRYGYHCTTGQFLSLMLAAMKSNSKWITHLR